MRLCACWMVIQIVESNRIGVPLKLSTRKNLTLGREHACITVNMWISMEGTKTKTKTNKKKKTKKNNNNKKGTGFRKTQAYSSFLHFCAHTHTCDMIYIFIYIYILGYRCSFMLFYNSSASTASMRVNTSQHSYACAFKLLNVLFTFKYPLYSTGMSILFFFGLRFYLTTIAMYD